MRSKFNNSLFAILAIGVTAHAQQRYRATGIVVAANSADRTITISHNAIPGYMEAMSMPFHLRDTKVPAVKPGDTVSFTLFVDKRESWIGEITVVEFYSAERDPVAARRLKLLDSLTAKAIPPLQPGQRVPDFRLTDQSNRQVSLAAFEGHIVVLNFIYTRCPLPDYCFRLSSNFARLQKRFAARKDLTLLTVTFDPIHDTPDVLANYAKVWKADLTSWHFLTGPPADVERLGAQFGVANWQDDGLYTHTLHTVVIDRRGKLLANLEGNKFTAVQLGDLVATALKSPD